MLGYLSAIFTDTALTILDRTGNTIFTHAKTIRSQRT